MEPKAGEPDVAVGVRRSLGVPRARQLDWGTHICHFYRGRQDLIDLLVPYFREGLENNEFCVWVASEPLQISAALEAMHAAVPGFDDALTKGQIQFRRHDDSYAEDGSVDADRIVGGWLDTMAAARADGYEGLRATGYVPWLDKTHWRAFTQYEAALNDATGGHRIVALCGYSLDTCTASELFDVLRNHQYGLVKQDDEWSLIKQPEPELASVLAARARQRARLAHDINNTIVQGLVAAELAYDLGENEHARDLLRATSRQARGWVGQLLDEPLRVGDARIDQPATEEPR